MSTNIPHLLTFPRSASHYFDRLMYKRINFHIERSHTVNHLFDKDNKKTRNIITIARDPKESILSLIALEKSIIPNSNRVNEIVSEYILLYSFLYDNADYVIKYQDLVQYPEIVIENVLDFLNINEENYINYVTNINYDSKRFVESSKTLPDYENIDLSNSNIDLCYFYYNKLLSRVVELTKP
jgi:hypothetical protein